MMNGAGDGCSEEKIARLFPPCDNVTCPGLAFPLFCMHLMHDISVNLQATRTSSLPPSAPFPPFPTRQPSASAATQETIDRHGPKHTKLCHNPTNLHQQKTNRRTAMTTTDHSVSAHGLLLISIAGFDAPLNDSFHALQRALLLCHRVTLVVSIPTSSPTKVSGPNGSNSHGAVTKKGVASFHDVQRFLSALYVSFSKHAQELQRPLAELDIVFQDTCGYEIGTGVADEIPFQVLLGLPAGKSAATGFFLLFLFEK